MRANGSTPAPASAPNSTALITLPLASAKAAMSKATSSRAASRQAASRAAGSARPSASAILSVMENTRCVEAMRSVRSGVTKPRSTARARFHQLGGKHDVDVARHGQQAQDRRAPRDLAAVWEQFDIIDRRAGALRHARDRGALCEITAVLGEIDDPVRKHAAAFAAEGKDGNGDRPGLGDLSVHRTVIRVRKAAASRHGARSIRR